MFCGGFLQIWPGSYDLDAGKVSNNGSLCGGVGGEAGDRLAEIVRAGGVFRDL